MPAGPDAMGFAYFLAAKFAGYTAFCHWVVAPRLAAGSEEASATPVPVSPLWTALSDSAERAESGAATPSSLKAGVIRTLIGVAVGAVVGFGFWKIPYFSYHDSVGTLLFFGLLVPVRVGEWALLYWWIYRMHPFADPGGLKLITWGILASFALDFVGIVAAWVLPGGMWVC